MRKTTLLIGCFSLLTLTGSGVASASVASPGFSFSRPNTTTSQFQSDTQRCERSAYLHYMRGSVPKIWYSTRDANGSNLRIMETTPAYPEEDSPKDGFISCMSRQGYRRAAAGFQTGPLWTGH